MLHHVTISAIVFAMGLNAIAAMPSSDVNSRSGTYENVDLLEAMGCGYATYRLFRPQTYFDLRSAVDVEEGDPKEGQACRIPRWLRKEKEILRLRGTQLPFARFQTMMLSDEVITLNGLEATVAPSFPFWDRRPVGAGLMSYLDFSMQTETGNETWGFSFGITPSLGFTSLASLGSKVRFYVYEGFAKANYGWAELELGKLQLQFGNAVHGNLLLSGATAPMTFLRFGLRPHKIGFLGPATFQTFLTTETGATTTDGAHLLGFHFGLRPTTWLDIGLLELYQFGGPAAPGLEALDLLKMLIYASDDDMNQRRQKMLALTLGLRPDASVHLYTQFAFDSLNGFDQLGNDVSKLVGLHLARLGPFGLRLEYATTTPGAYQAPNWKSGLVYDGTPVGHPLGPDAEGIYADLYFPDLAEWRTAAGVFREQRGLSLTGAALQREERLGFSLSVKKRWVKTELELEGKYSNVESAKNKPGADLSVGAGRLLLKYSFL